MKDIFKQLIIDYQEKDYAYVKPRELKLKLTLYTTTSFQP